MPLIERVKLDQPLSNGNFTVNGNEDDLVENDDQFCLNERTQKNNKQVRVCFTKYIYLRTRKTYDVNYLYCRIPRTFWTY